MFTLLFRSIADRVFSCARFVMFIFIGIFKCAGMHATHVSVKIVSFGLDFVVIQSVLSIIIFSVFIEFQVLKNLTS